MFYFAYGSNLSAVHWDQWCRKRGYSPGGLVPRWRAFLPDYELAFRYPSKRWGGGAADLRPRSGAAVPGMIFEADAQAMAALDAKEGLGRVYERITAHALSDDDTVREVVTYRVLETRRVPHLAPSPAYFSTILSGLRDFGLPIEPLRASASGEPGSPYPGRIFAYGTLLSGEGGHDHVAHPSGELLGPAAVSGRLYHLGDFPGLVPGEGRVSGELYAVRDPSVYSRLDRWEDFLGYGVAGSSYVRVLKEVETPEGETSWAWTYHFVGPVRSSSLITSGDWRHAR